MTDLLTSEELRRHDPRTSKRCRRCGEPILGRPRTATTCLVHRGFPAPPSRSELVALIAEYSAAVEQLRAALSALDAEATR